MSRDMKVVASLRKRIRQRLFGRKELWCQAHHAWDSDKDGRCGAYATAHPAIRSRMGKCELVRRYR